MFHGGVIKKEIEALHSVALNRLAKSKLLKVVKYEDTVMEKVLEKEMVVKRLKKKKSKKKLDQHKPKIEEVDLPKLVGAKSPNQNLVADKSDDLLDAVKDEDYSGSDNSQNIIKDKDSSNNRAESLKQGSFDDYY